MLAIFEATGTETSRAYWLARIAEGFLADGNVTEGLVAVEDALESRETHLGRFNAVELQRIKGELLLLEPADPGEAERCFRNALELAKSQHAHRLGLEAAVSFACMLRTYERTDEARDVLRTAHDRMPEAHDSPLAASARRLLDELS